jgi:hypothetical protein
MVVCIVEQKDQTDVAYDQLKATLVSSHTMSDYQRIELLSNVEQLGGRKPSDLLATILELCQCGYDAVPFFCYLFLHRLPRGIRVLFVEEDATNMGPSLKMRTATWPHKHLRPTTPWGCSPGRQRA